MPLNLADLMNDTIVVNARNSIDKYGKRGFASSGTTYTNCRVQTGSKLIRDAAGKEVIENGRVYVLGQCNISIGDKVTLPSGNTPTVILIDDVSDEHGIDHVVLHFAEGA